MGPRLGCYACSRLRDDQLSRTRCDSCKNGKTILIECKTTKKDRLSLKTNMLELKKFADISGGDAYIAIRFYRKEQRFYSLEKQLTKGNYTITEKDPFMSLDTILSEQERL